jgi:hypothetical protein
MGDPMMSPAPVAKPDPDGLESLRQRLDACLDLLAEISIRSNPRAGQAARRRGNRIVHHLNTARAALAQARELSER